MTAHCGCAPHFPYSAANGHLGWAHRFSAKNGAWVSVCAGVLISFLLLWGNTDKKQPREPPFPSHSPSLRGVGDSKQKQWRNTACWPTHGHVPSWLPCIAQEQLLETVACSELDLLHHDDRDNPSDTPTSPSSLGKPSADPRLCQVDKEGWLGPYILT